MRVKMRATFIYEWIEDSENWGDPEPKPATKEELLELVKDYAKGDLSNILDRDIESWSIELA